MHSLPWLPFLLCHSTVRYQFDRGFPLLLIFIFSCNAWSNDGAAMPVLSFLQEAKFPVWGFLHLFLPLLVFFPFPYHAIIDPSQSPLCHYVFIVISLTLGSSTSYFFVLALISRILLRKLSNLCFVSIWRLQMHQDTTRLAQVMGQLSDNISS